ncbi:MAG TPA: hypothetical protein VES60_09015 [Nakamurella sp.]|nr:hypothetical protein [Nakamurella sp.]
MTGGRWTTPTTVTTGHKKPADGLACPAISDGQLWLDVKGSLTDGDIGLNADGEARINASDRSFQLTANVAERAGFRRVLGRQRRADDLP